MNHKYIRVNRMFHLDKPQTGNRGWYFEVRDGLPRGPYASLALASMALRTYLYGLEKSQPDRERVVEAWGERVSRLEARIT
jgi:hypothetical protein